MKACVDCHDTVDAKVFANSVHGGMACVDCHTQGPFKDHDGETPAKVTCGKCHEEIEKEYLQSFHGQARSKGITDAPACIDCHGNAHAIQASDSLTAPHARKNIQAMCAKCHADIKIAKKYDIPVENPSELYKNSIHGKAVAAGNLKAAVCSDCHGSHTIQPGRLMTSKTAKKEIPKTCGKCHVKILEDYGISIHGQSVANGNTDAPACSDCHGEHGIVKANSIDSPVSPTQVATKTCGHCHSDLTLSKRYGFSAERLTSYLSSYHGLGVRRGSVTVANCSSCHGVHAILASKDPKSSINPKNLPKTCGSCHPGATESFTNTSVHLSTSPTSEPILYYVRVAYLWMIFATIGLMFLHNLLIYVSAVVQKIRAVRKKKTYRRFTTIQLVMHGLLLTSFITLVITGFGLKFPDAIWTGPLKFFHLTEEARRIIHRVAACVMTLGGFMHVFHSIFTQKGREEIWELLPRISDLREAIGYVRYYVLHLFGKPAPHPHMGRYTYIHKAEYWALIWGTVVMTVTGLVLWFPVIFSRVLPPWGIPLMELIHYYEAWLATLAIVVWHFFFVVFHPSEYPMSTSWLTGEVSKEEMEREHPRELEAIESTASVDDSEKKPRT